MNTVKKNILWGDKTTVIIILTTLVTICSCYYNNAGLVPIDCSTVQPKFNADVLPVIQSRCATPACHDASASGGIILQNYNQIFTIRDRIKTRAVIQKTMPVFTPLNAVETAIIKCWIDDGALNN
ncbi:MAG: hypothetical protein IPJ81_13875 [Chitinophagaceae bacterium]|nr:hypothetical protein [Chitinophagaceae bacterium]